jgi:hypothetical protein
MTLNGTVTCGSSSSINNANLTGTPYLNGQYLYYSGICGVYMIDGSYEHHPLITSLSTISQASQSSFTVNSVNVNFPQANLTGSSTIGSSSQSVIPSSNDIIYLIMPAFGVIAYNATNYGGSVVLNVGNTSSKAIYCSPTTTKSALSWKVYYDGSQI